MARPLSPKFKVLRRPYGHSPDGVMLGAGLPRYRVKAWRVPNEDGASRPVSLAQIVAALDVRTQATLIARFGQWSPA